MLDLLAASALLLAFANGANDNFKGVATLWGTGRYSYRRVLLWATAWTLAGGLVALAVGRRLVDAFSGRAFLASEASPDPAFLAAAALGAAAGILLATRLGAPVSTTHALVGSLIGSGLAALGVGGLSLAPLLTTVLLPLLLSPLLALSATVLAGPPLARWLRVRSCLCLTQAPALVVGQAELLQASAPALVGLRIAHRADCTRGNELITWNTEELIHWSSAGLISFARGLNDTPKIAALLLPVAALGVSGSHLLVALAMAVGGLLAAGRVARTMSQEVTPIRPLPGLTANLAAAVLVGAASGGGLPVSTTHATLGGIFGVALGERARANWRLAGQIVAAWLVTLPLGVLSGFALHRILQTLQGG